MITAKKTPTGLTIDIETGKRSEKQLHAIKSMLNAGDVSTLIKYLKSLKGSRHPYIDVPRFKSSGEDKLESKRSNTFLHMFERMLDTDTQHSPLDKNRSWIGVEIECCVPYSSVGVSEECVECDGTGTLYTCDDDGNEADSHCCDRCDGSGIFRGRSNSDRFEALGKMFQSERIKYINVKSDGSISAPDGFFAVEITVLTRLDRPDNLKKACELLNKIGAKVNKSCGLHVHLDARHLGTSDVKKIGVKFERALPVLAAMVPPTRRSNTYCALSVSGLKGGRYHAVNLTAYRKFRTIEIRLHSSTTDFQKIIHWAKLLSAIFNASKIPRIVSNLNDLTDFVSIPEDTLEYCAQRTALFSPEPVCAPEYRDNDSSDTQLEIGA